MRWTLLKIIRATATATAATAATAVTTATAATATPTTTATATPRETTYKNSAMCGVQTTQFYAQ